MLQGLPLGRGDRPVRSTVCLEGLERTRAQTYTPVLSKESTSSMKRDASVSRPSTCRS